MMHIVKPGTSFDFMGKAPLFARISAAIFLVAVLVISLRGVNLGLDFAGGHEILLEFESAVSAEDARSQLAKLKLGDHSVQRFEVPGSPKTFYLVRIERSETFGKKEIDALNQAFESRYGPVFERLRYNPEAGDVIEVEFAENATSAADISDPAISQVVKGTHHDVRVIRRRQKADNLALSVVLKGVDVAVLGAMKTLDPSVKAARVEFVGPTVGKQLRDDGILAVLYALVCILIYVAFRFDIFYSPGAIICLFHDSVITVAILSLLGEEFSLATIAGILTLVGYSINDTIVVFDRIRETAGKAQGLALSDILNRAINETLGRTLMTSVSTLVACVCLMVFGRGTVLASFGLIMTVGILIGTYSSLYVAAPIFMTLRERFSTAEASLSAARKKGGPAPSGA